jgi:hypothetical protein
MSAFEEGRPYESYAAIVAAFGGLLATVGLAVANDFLQAGFAALAPKASELDSEAS